MSVLKVVTIVPLIAAREGIKLGHLLWRVYIPTWPNWRPGPAPGATVLGSELSYVKQNKKIQPDHCRSLAMAIVQPC